MVKKRWRHYVRVASWTTGFVLLFVLYCRGLSRNPPGFYLDESGLTYNAYLVARTGAGEFGPRFPLFFQCFSDGFIQTFSPIQIYILAFLFLFFPPSILLARLFSAGGVFGACIVLGFLAARLSGRRTVGVIVGATALLTPWFFEARGLLIEAQFLPLPLALFLLALFNVHRKEKWSAVDVLKLIGSLVLMSYSTITGRFLAPFLVLGLLFFATTRQRLISVIATGFCYGLTLVPIVVFNWSHSGLLTKRFHEISYIRPELAWPQVASQFLRRYLEDQSLTSLLLTGDYHPRHHVQGAGGALFFGTFLLAVVGLLLVLLWYRRDPWWRYVLYGLALSIVPGAITVEPFHTTRLMAYPVFLLLLTVPALDWLLGAQNEETKASVDGLLGLSGEERRSHVATTAIVVSRLVRFACLVLVLGLTLVEAYRFQVFFRREGRKRSYEFDVPYKTAYDLATRQPLRPIYLEDGKWGPAYIHALWYATLEGRPVTQFVHLAPDTKPPSGAIVISAADTCIHCQTIAHPGVYLVYKAL